MNEQSVYEWARKYLNFYSLIPVGNDKKPLIEWKEYQSRKPTEEEIKTWFDKPNPPNIGIVTGKISGITVVDVEKGGKWEHYPVTQTAKTGGGGYHLYYKYAEGMGNKARIFELTDIRGDGGYVVAPPSTHASGNKYEWTRKELTQPFPYTIFNTLPSNIKKNDWESLLGGNISQGERNQTATQVIGKFLSVLPPEEWNTTAWQMFVHWNGSNTPPLDEKELRSVFNSIVGREVRKPKKKIEGYDVETQEDESEVKLISEIVGELTDDLDVRYATGYEVLDEAFRGGMKDGDLWFITGYSGHGKTSFSQSITYNLIKAGQPVLWFTYEVMIHEIWRKFKEMGVSNDFLAYAPAVNVTGKLEWVEKKIRESRDKYKTKIVFIDHLGFLLPRADKNEMTALANYSAYLGSICRELKSLAVREKIVIVLMGHLRKPLNGKTEDPTYHDIKDSASVAQESDAVIIVNRKRDKGAGGFGGSSDIYSNDTEIKIEKNRVTGSTKVFGVTMSEGRLIDFKDEIKQIGFNINNK